MRELCLWESHFYESHFHSEIFTVAVERSLLKTQARSLLCLFQARHECLKKNVMKRPQCVFGKEGTLIKTRARSLLCLFQAKHECLKKNVMKCPLCVFGKERALT